MKKHTFSLWSWLADSIEQIIQVVALVIVTALPFRFNFQAVVENKKPSLEIQELATYYALRHGNICIAVLLALLMIVLFHKINSESVLNRGNRYHRRTMCEYWIYARLLGYKKCNLMRVPIADQYKLILSDLFPEYICGDCEPAPEDETISVRMYGNRPNSESGIIMQHMEARDSSLKFQGNEIFLAISDTYPISEGMLPNICTEQNTAIIQRDQNKGDNVRYKSKALVRELMKIIRGLNESTIVHIFPTTNVNNTFEIVNQIFKMAGRDNIEHLYVHSQPHKTAMDWKFSEKKKKIF